MIWKLGRRAIRPIQQMEAAECGVASLAMVLDYFGATIPLEELREECGTSRDGNSALQILQCGQRLGLKGCGLKLTLEQLKAAHGPLILHWRMNHFVVFEKFHRGHAVLLDPGSGRIKADEEELDRCFSGIALRFEKTPQLLKRKRVSPGVTRYFDQLKTGRTTVLFILIAGAAGQLLGVVAPALQQVLIDEVIAPVRESWLIPLLTVQVVVVIAVLLLSWLSQSIMVKFQTSLGASLVNQMGRRLLRLPLNFVESRSRGDLVQRVAGYAGLGELLTQTATGMFQLVFAFGLAGLMLAYEPRLAALALVIDGLRIVLIRRLREDSRQRSAGELSARAAETSIVLQAASAGEVIEAFGLQMKLQKWYSRKLNERLVWSVKASRLTQGASCWLGTFDGLGQASVYWIGGAMVIDSEMTLGVFAGFLAIRGLLQGPLGSVLATVESWIEFRSVLGRTDEILNQPVQPAGKLCVNNPAPVLELRNVGFRYSSGSPWLFRGVSIRIQPGENIAFVGPSGQGKSTLLRIVAGILPPTEGEVLLDGLPLEHYTSESLARSVGAVVGTPVVVTGTVRENLALRVPEATAAELQESSQIACFDEVVARIPRGYAFELRAEGASLSGGELQRMGLVQALVGRPSILLLDEATCFLDQETESKILANIAHSGTTIVSVAHRQAVIDAAETVFQVQAGQVQAVHSHRSVQAPSLPGCHVVQASFAGGQNVA